MTKGGKQEVAEVGHNSYAGTRFNAVTRTSAFESKADVDFGALDVCS